MLVVEALPPRGKESVLTAESQKENGPFPSRNRRVLVFSIGAGNESHGAALPSNIDDYAAIMTAATAAMRLGLTYVGHLPYSSDRAGEAARDWNPGYMPKEELIALMVEEVKRAIVAQARSLANEASMVVVVSGHGGNNFLHEEEARIALVLGVPFHYIPPFPGGSSVRTKKRGKMEVTHADDGEHSMGLYLGILDEEKLKTINEIARQDPVLTLRQNPAIMGLGYYVLPELGGDKYQDLRLRHPELLRKASRFVKKDRLIVADVEEGRELMHKNLYDTIRSIKRLLR